MASSSSTHDELSERNQDQQDEPPPQQHQQPPLKECIHKTKTVHFLGRTTPIVLQNDNGPCPLLAICNVLLLRNNLNLSPDIPEVSQEKLLSLVAERLIDSNSNVNNKDAGYLQNQQQNIADAIDLLPRLATGIDVNLKFRRIDDFEFTPECAIFDLLDIPLYHGWIVDSQDYDTANAIGSKSYNALMGELVALETQNMEGQYKNTPEENCVDFVAATTATLGIPSPNLSRSRSFNDSPHSVSDNQILRKGDLEEEAELLRALNLSEASSPSVSDPVVGHVNGETMSVIMDENKCHKEVILVGSEHKLENITVVGNNDSYEPEPSLPDNCIDSGKNSIPSRSSESTFDEAAKLSLKVDAINDLDQSTCMGPEQSIGQNDEVEKNCLDKLVQNESSSLLSPEKDSVSLHGSHGIVLGEDKKVHDQFTFRISDHEAAEEPHGSDATRLSCSSASHANSDLSSGKIRQTDASEASSVDGNEPIYEGEECVLGTRTATFENREPVYEGEAVLAEQVDKSTLVDGSLGVHSEITPQQGELIRSFLRNNASQLTFYGLFCLLDGLKERELCVFFRNNHFSTMFKFEGELYLLATDLGYLNQPDLVWEKLYEVNGDTLFMTSNFKEFIIEGQDNNTWDEHNAMTSTADYLACIDSGGQADLNINSDLQLAIALQQQEFEQQQPRHNSQQFSSGDSSRLVSGSQVARNTGRLSAIPTPTPPFSSSSSSPKAEGKFKERCIVM